MIQLTLHFLVHQAVSSTGPCGVLSGASYELKVLQAAGRLYKREENAGSNIAASPY